MQNPVSLSAGAPEPLRVQAYSSLWRWVAGALVAISRVGLLAVLFMGLRSPVPVPLFAWLRLLGALVLAPALVAAWIQRALAVEVDIGAAALVLRRRGLRVEIPYAAIARIRPWRVPLPSTGVSLRMRSGRRFSYGLYTAEPSAFLSALAEVGRLEAARAALGHPNLVYAEAKRRGGPWRWYHYAVKYVLFAVGPAAIWFNLNQHVMFGGTLGQYYLQGLAPYLKTWSIHWGLVIVYLLLYASVWRGLAEGVALLAAWVAAQQAQTVRGVAELVCRLVYYIGVPIIVVLPFLR